MRCVLLALFLATGVSVAPSQNEQSSPSGTARIRRTVVDAVTATPVRRASLRLTMTAPGGRTWTAITDGSGAFEFPVLPAGRFVLTATKAAMSRAALVRLRAIPHAGSRRRMTGRSTSRQSGLPRGGVITGRIVAAARSTRVRPEDATFRVRGLIGKRYVRVSGLPPGWVLESVRAGGFDVTEFGWQVPGGRLPPAAYFAFAVLPLTDGECAEPDQLERTAAHATRFAIGAGQSINVALRLQDR